MDDSEPTPADVPGILSEAESPALTERSTRPAPRWVTPMFAVLALVLVGYVFVLGLTLPPSATARHWDLAWEGFDVGLLTSLAASAYFAWKKNPYVTAATSVTATFLAIDAWFDTVTSKGGGDQIQALSLALGVELPLAFVCVYLARHAEHVNARTIEKLAEHITPE